MENNRSTLALEKEILWGRAKGNKFN
ncbi:uncharacterized protein G2W53_035046 [Senna tora]|uniref:Uncharacterized protein n=1 Tax=Senna tora TaxID=362788 RepID=A0A834SS67_9FABA|nr:uncharacterized protein G2W53_035046 [Senna tora]